jgi:hypothetical protein
MLAQCWRGGGGADVVGTGGQRVGVVRADRDVRNSRDHGNVHHPHHRPGLHPHLRISEPHQHQHRAAAVVVVVLVQHRAAPALPRVALLREVSVPPRIRRRPRRGHLVNQRIVGGLYVRRQVRRASRPCPAVARRTSCSTRISSPSRPSGGHRTRRPLLVVDAAAPHPWAARVTQCHHSPQVQHALLRRHQPSKGSAQPRASTGIRPPQGSHLASPSWEAPWPPPAGAPPPAHPSALLGLRQGWGCPPLRRP